ncbi:MarR family transcriptional regulator [Bacillus xiamenensis]|uniref:Transcriptional regulator n=1 Tax=Bacillus xiamenensis TaxID=1178537 RepID=A0AAC9IIJ4_9BACI|nr:MULTISPECIES: MarR family transcriptional regulator [Bacillus]AOZ89357.1 MarR family transcriptional regulator [Bacillus xiamenensis]EKF33968.1 MarR family transcriptional regulator [Bacillus xiamenensis]MBG9911955.1 MarR family transcriptional regulator [Bacillus xiamenensis]MCW1835263.1 transcriptional regulator [Bacillus xiamenensis]MCY9574475.1 transcriptional regulator [Bacillus xiamenensis]
MSNADILKEIVLVHYEVSRKLNRKLLELEKDITPPQIYALSILIQGKVSHAEELKQRLSLNPGAASIALNKLCEQGYIQRERDKADQSLVRLEATEKGLAIYEKHTRLFGRVVQHMMSDFTEEDLKTFLAYLQKMRKTFHDE